MTNRTRQLLGGLIVLEICGSLLNLLDNSGRIGASTYGRVCSRLIHGRGSKLTLDPCLSRLLRIGGLTYEDSRRIADRKSAWLVLYLRARRDGDTLLDFYRRQHFLTRAGRFPGMKES